MGDDVGVDAEDAGVSASDPGQAVGAQLSHSAGQVQGAAHHRRQVHHPAQGQPGEIGTGVEPSVLAGHLRQRSRHWQRLDVDVARCIIPVTLQTQEDNR